MTQQNIGLSKFVVEQFYKRHPELDVKSQQFDQKSFDVLNLWYQHVLQGRPDTFDEGARFVYWLESPEIWEQFVAQVLIAGGKVGHHETPIFSAFFNAPVTVGAPQQEAEIEEPVGEVKEVELPPKARKIDALEPVLMMLGGDDGSFDLDDMVAIVSYMPDLGSNGIIFGVNLFLRGENFVGMNGLEWWLAVGLGLILTIVVCIMFSFAEYLWLRAKDEYVRLCAHPLKSKQRHLYHLAWSLRAVVIFRVIMVANLATTTIAVASLTRYSPLGWVLGFVIAVVTTWYQSRYFGRRSETGDELDKSKINHPTLLHKFTYAIFG